MDYQTIDLLIKGATLALSISGNIGVVVLWFISKGRATQAAIDRVEANAQKQHSDQEARLVKLETEIGHLIGKSQLDDALKPLYDLVRSNKEDTAGMKSELNKIAEGQRDLVNKILDRGLK